jgi:hypothetical protein
MAVSRNPIGQHFAIQTHFSDRFYLAAVFLGLCRNGSLSRRNINQVQVSLEQASRHRNFDQLERDIAATADDLGIIFD